jgi:hypothetical protein
VILDPPIAVPVQTLDHLDHVRQLDLDAALLPDLARRGRLESLAQPYRAPGHRPEAIARFFPPPGEEHASALDHDGPDRHDRPVRIASLHGSKSLEPRA